MKNKNIIDGDKFQKEYKDQLRKDKTTNLIEGIAAILIAIFAFSVDEAFFLKILIYILAASLILQVGRRLFMLYKNREHKPLVVGELIQLIIMLIFAIFLLANPIKTLSSLLTFIGLFIILKSILIIFTTNYKIPIGALSLGIIMIIFGGIIIKFVFNLFTLLILIYGISKIINVIYTK